MKCSEGLTKRKNVSKDGSVLFKSDKLQQNDQDLNELEFTLMEEIVLLELSNKNGFTSFWNDCISSSLRGCILIELALRDRIQLENVGIQRKSLLERNIILKSSIPTGITILDETIKHIKDSSASFNTVHSWIKYLSGESWNPLYLKYQLCNVRERIAKDLVEKRVAAIEKQNFFLFDVTAFPLINNDAKNKIIQKVVRFLLSDWCNDVQQVNKRTLSLILMAQASNVLECSLKFINDNDYGVIQKRIDRLTELNFEQESRKSGNEILWAVFEVFFNT